MCGVHRCALGFMGLHCELANASANYSSRTPRADENACVCVLRVSTVLRN